MSQPAFLGGLSQEDPDLSERLRQVFLALVHAYGSTARPVGSETLARRFGIRLSPASIRSALAELEKLGLLERAHTSSGRIPSAFGYQMFVRAQLDPTPLPAELMREVEERLRRSTEDVEQLLGEASRVLSSLTQQLGLAMTASVEAERLSDLELARLDERRALLVLSLGGAAVRTLVLELESPLEQAELDSVAVVLRERLVGHSLAAVRDRLADDPVLVRDSAVRLVARTAAAAWGAPGRGSLQSSGADRIAAQPEFASGSALGPVLRVVESGPPLDRLLLEGVTGLSAVRVGLDEDLALQGCSLVSYPLPGAVRGAVGVLGPLRMDYARALAAVDLVGTRVSELLARGA
ncbi:MAG TPA: heat-inducible transcriptional repressor HrcA [Candidatus Limnocylindria bacterium]|nr:heat-inducible transcriptional repressor HrcA [Candidatus Limnocylindria bacterium]